MKKQTKKKITTTKAIDIVADVYTPLTDNSPLRFATSLGNTPQNFRAFLDKDNSEKENPISASSQSSDKEEEKDNYKIIGLPDDSPSSDDDNTKEVYKPRNRIVWEPYYGDNTDYGDNTESGTDKSDNALFTPYVSVMIERLVPAVIIGAGTGIAMMPIFNHLVKNSEDFGIDIHSNRALFIASTANTFIVSSLSSFSSIYHFVEKYQQTQGNSTDNRKLSTTLSKIAASWSIILPLGLLWMVELQNQKIAKSEGFDEFIAWATFTTIPLVADRIVESVKAIDNIYDRTTNCDLSTIGSKLMVYGLSTLSAAGRAIAYTEVAKTIALATGINETSALIVGIAAGGVLGSGGVTLFEYQAVKSLFEEQDEPLNIKKIITAAISIIEGAWFTLPIIGLGLKATEDWNSLLKGALFTPLFVSHSIFESTTLYDNMMISYDTISESINYWLGDHCNYDNVEIPT